MLASGILKFSAFPNIEGNLIQARLLMPAGTPLKQTEKVGSRKLAGKACRAVENEIKFGRMLHGEYSKNCGYVVRKIRS
ncbi:MAG: hypothetical protein ACJAV1_000030 [Paraglaciecola sp.]|jgi:hypothetical protein